MLKPYLPLMAMTALLTAAATVAQPQTTSTDAGTTSESAPPASTPAITPAPTTGTASTTTTTGASATATTGTAAASPLQGQDATFLRKAVEGDRTEIASAQDALDNAQRSDTKNAARMILDDHQRSSQALQALASRKGWTLPEADADAAESDEPMAAAAGTGSFDDRFMAEQIRMHREAISLYRAQVSGGSDPDLRQFARDQLPHLEHHLEMLQGSNTQK